MSGWIPATAYRYLDSPLLQILRVAAAVLVIFSEKKSHRNQDCGSSVITWVRRRLPESWSGSGVVGVDDQYLSTQVVIASRPVPQPGWSGRRCEAGIFPDRLSSARKTSPGLMTWWRLMPLSTSVPDVNALVVNHGAGRLNHDLSSGGPDPEGQVSILVVGGPVLHIETTKFTEQCSLDHDAGAGAIIDLTDIHIFGALRRITASIVPARTIAKTIPPHSWRLPSG